MAETGKTAISNTRATGVTMNRSVLIALGLLAGLALPAAAQAPDASEMVPERVVVQAAPGPAVWHLTRGDSEVWILGTVGAMPKGLTWNHAYLSDLLSGARAILMPPRPDVGLLEGAWFLITNGSKLSLPHGQTLEGGLPDPLKAHFIATRTAIGQKENRYSTDTPIRAAIRLQSDFQDKTGLSSREPGATIASLAKSQHVPSAPVSKYEVIDAIKQVLNLSLAQQQVCLGEAVEDVDRMSAHADIAARAWAHGDIRTVKANYAQPRLYDCIIAAVQKASDINARNDADYAAAIDAALNKPGKTIAVIGVGPLLRKNGVLERLQAKGIAIDSPVEN
jgi:uncharacterized protein YbaP (TraB family)